MHPLSSRKRGAIAQLVEQRTENPCVPGSIPGGTTERNANDLKSRLLAFFLLSWTSNLATFDQNFDTFFSIFAGYYNKSSYAAARFGWLFFCKKNRFFCSSKKILLPLQSKNCRVGYFLVQSKLLKL